MNDLMPPPHPFTIVGDSDPGPLFGAVVAIGNFDGVHRGHRTVIDAARKLAAGLGRKAAALTFSPHPRRFFQPEAPMFRLSSERDKLRLLAATGLDGAFVVRFDAELAATPARDFVERILVGRFGIAGATIGFDFHFGHKRGGSPEFLAAEGKRLGFPVDIVPPLADEGRPVSSGAVRAALAEGRVRDAAGLLGGPWFISGEVIHGAKRGRELGFPTANIRLDPSCGLRHGVYAVRMAVGGKLYDGVASFGIRPMFDAGAPLLEVFLFDFTGDLYGQIVDVAIIDWIRPELKFDSLDELKVAMAADVAQAREALRLSAGAFPVLGEI
jgi:riboflavin kinase/FMN adenylyltransferase